MAYTIISQNNSITTLSDENGNVITVPSRSILDAGTTFTLVKINNSTATLEDSNGKIYRDIPCCVDLTQVTGFTVTKVNNNKATLEDADGITYAGVPCIVNLTESGGGSSAVIDPLNVTPSTSAQTITASGGVDGYSPVNVSAVDASIDANIVAGNIKKDVSILGVTGTYEGQTPTGSISITSNGTYDVTDKAEAVVNVPTTAPAHYVEKIVDANGVLQNSANIINLNGVTNIADYVLSGAYAFVDFPENTIFDMSSITSLSGLSSCQNMFSCKVTTQKSLTGINLSGLITISGSNTCNSMLSHNKQLVSVDLSSLTTINGSQVCYSMFTGCSGLTSVDLPSLTTINGQSACGQMFSGCTMVTSINLPTLITINGSQACQYMFGSCSGLTSVDLPSLTTISASNACGQMFYNCSGLTSVKMNKLNVITQQISSSYSIVFQSCNKLESVELGGLTASTFASKVNQIQYLFDNYTGRDAPNGCTVHFPSNFDPADPNHTFDASTLAGYPTFGGNASYIHVAFDLPATE
ncbi:MAG: leucine-rich repeat protein [Alphaproteobacteria bacterium]